MPGVQQASRTIGKKTTATMGKGLNALFDYGIPLAVGGIGYMMSDVFNVYSRLSNFLQKRLTAAKKDIPENLGERIVLYTAVIYVMLGVVARYMLGGGVLGNSVCAFFIGIAVSFYGAGGSP